MSLTSESDTLTYKHTPMCDQCLRVILTLRGAGILNGDQVDMMQAESDGERQAEMRDALSTLLRLVSS